jgi:ectoine hydroxylase-related dioxygenase (phytanoyl-CoA dioxygenase family)
MQGPHLRDVSTRVETEGFAIREGVLSTLEVARLLAAIERIDQLGSVRKHGGIFAVRNLLDVSSEVRELAGSPAVCTLVESVLGPGFFPVRGILFDKIADANWKVPWHQDVTIAVQERVEADGFGPWSMKADVLHVQPPAFVLERMISIRLHLDPCDEANGALRIIPGSHRLGRIPEARIAAVREGAAERVCELGVGGALLMRPLLLHASSPSRVPRHRRVVHLDFAAIQLPDGMRWLSSPSEQDSSSGRCMA